jgi:hypothetical protein
VTDQSQSQSRPLLAESWLPVGDAVELEIGMRPHPVTISRWCNQGLRGRRLESLLVCGRRMTSLEAVRRFVVGAESPAS